MKLQNIGDKNNSDRIPSNRLINPVTTRAIPIKSLADRYLPHWDEPNKLNGDRSYRMDSDCS